MLCGQLSYYFIGGSTRSNASESFLRLFTLMKGRLLVSMLLGHDQYYARAYQDLNNNPSISGVGILVVPKKLCPGCNTEKSANIKYFIRSPRYEDNLKPLCIVCSREVDLVSDEVCPCADVG